MDYPTNSKTPAKEPDKKDILQIVSGKVVRKATPAHKKLLGSIFSGNPTSVRTYVIMEVLLPAFQETLLDVISQGSQRIVRGDDRERNSKKRGAWSNSYDDRKSRFNYAGQFSSQNGGRRDAPPAKNRPGGLDIGDIYLEHRVEAESILTAMTDISDRYEAVTVADLFNLLGVTSEYTDQKWGWENLRDARVVRTSDGYLLDLPPTTPITQ